MKTITVYTDGACSGNPGPGGWAAILLYNQHERILQGGEKQTTNNRMELQAAIEALHALKEPCQVSLHTDSNYLVNAFNAGWLQNWVRKNWRKADNKPVENKDLWEKLLILTEKHRVQFIKVKGHADDALNNRVDRLAVEAVPKP
ncbi:MAG: ribonuclease HI [Bacteroidetes Order II. Incertae sedis bacterium]|nr:ribonuclease HI [Bacteroidetes Order II. bacterium]